MAENGTVNIVHELTFVTNTASVEKVDQTIATITRSLQALNQNTKQVGSSLNTIINSLGNAGKAANDYANSMKRASEATAKFGQASAKTGNDANAAAAKITAGFDRTIKKMADMQNSMLIAMTASTKRLSALKDEAAQVSHTADEVKKLQAAYASLKGVQPRTAPVSSGGSAATVAGVGAGGDDDASRVFGVKLSAIQRRFVTGYIVGAGFSAFNATLDTIKEFMSESSEFASKLEGTSKAFERIADPGLLARLRQATGGTVSDLDLMQRSVNAVNLGLPVQNLAKAFEFARIRARETGQDVDYLVNSIVLGIGRKSPLILDNLGINALRVRERFKTLGDFAKAAFEIVNEEIEKSGTYVDAFADRMDRLNATIKNQQTEFGKLINAVKDYSIAITQDILGVGADATDEAVKNSPILSVISPGAANLKLARDLAKKDAEDTKIAQVEADKRYLHFYGEYQKKLEDADFFTRSRVLKNAQDKYDQLRNMDKDYAKQTGLDLNVVTKMFAQMNQRFKREVAPASLKNLQFDAIKKGTKEELEELIKSIELERTPLTSAELPRIERLASFQKEAQRNLDIINQKERRTRKPEIGVEADLAKRIAALQAQINDAREKDDADTTQKIEDHANTRIAKYNEELDALENAARRRGALSDAAQLMIGQLRFMVRELNAIIAGNDSRELFDKQLLALHKAYAERVAAGRKLMGAQSGEGNFTTIDAIRQQIEEERIAAETAEDDRNRAEIKKLRTQNEATENEEHTHFLNLENIRLEYNQKSLAAIGEYYEAVRKETTRIFAYELADVQEIIAGRQDKLNARTSSLFFGRARRQRMLDLRGNVDTTQAAANQAQGEYSQAQGEYDKVIGAVGTNPQTAQGRAAYENAIIKQAEAHKKASDAAKDHKTAEDGLHKAILENVLRGVEVYDALASAAVNAYNQIADAQKQQLDREIQIREERMQLAQRFAERGNTEYLRQEQERLDRAYKQQAQAANRQIAINTALAASQAAVGVVQAAAEGDPYTAIARVIAFVAAISAGVIQATNAANAAQPSVQFYKGGYTGDGDRFEPAGTVHKGEFVSNQETTRRHRKVLESMHDGTFDDKYAHVDARSLRMDEGRHSSDKATVKKLDEVRDAIENSSVNVRQSLDERGLLQLVERTHKRDRQRFSS